MEETANWMASTKPDVANWFTNCALTSRTALYKATAQFFYFYYMTLKIRQSEFSEMRPYKDDTVGEMFIDNSTVEELRRYMNIPDTCFSTVRQFTSQADGWRGQIGVTLAQRLAQRGLSRQWAGEAAGLRNPDVVEARRIFIQADARLAKASKDYDDEQVERRAAGEQGADSSIAGPLELRLLGGPNPWSRYRTTARHGIEVLGGAESR
jgi:hypothetical protein